MQISVWEKESFFAPKDILIVGSGLVGLWSAWYLKKKAPLLSITILDRGLIPTGASTRNAGFACFGSATELIADTKTMGDTKMLELVELRFRGLERIRKELGEKATGFEWCGGYELITEQNDPGKTALEDQLGWLNKQLRPITRKDRTFRLHPNRLKKFSFGHTAHLIGNKLEGALHSGQLCQALLQKVQGLGVTVLNGIEVTGYEKTGQYFSVHNSQQLPLKASQLLFCTNAFSSQLLPGVDIVPARGQMLLTSPIANLPFKGTFHYDEGFYYFRHLGNRVLLGGARNKAFEAETTTEMTTTELIQQELEHFLATYLLPGKAYTITDRWSGIMGMGSEKMPIIKEITPGVFCAVRMSGMGVALAPVAGEYMARQMA